MSLRARLLMTPPRTTRRSAWLRPAAIAAAITVADELLHEQAEIAVYDPKVSQEQVYSDLEYLGTHSPEQIRSLVSVYNDPYELCENAHAIAVLTEWDEFNEFDWERIYKGMKKPAFVFDGRNLLDAAKMKQLGFVYEAIGVR